MDTDLCSMVEKGWIGCFQLEEQRVDRAEERGSRRRLCRHCRLPDIVENCGEQLDTSDLQRVGPRLLVDLIAYTAGCLESATVVVST